MSEPKPSEDRGATPTGGLIDFFLDLHNKTVLFRVGNWVVTTYTFLAGAAFATGLSLALWFDAMVGVDTHMKAKFYLLVMAPLILIGLRSFSIMLEWRELFRRPMATLLKPGYMLHGGLAGGIVALACYWYFWEESLLLALDAGALGMPLGEAVARIGCYVYGCCWGRPTRTSPIGIRYTSPESKIVRALPHMRGVRVHPAQIYAMVVYTGMFIIFYQLLPYRMFDGQLAAMYLIGHSVARYALEYFREDDRGKLWGPFTHTNLYSLLMVLGGVIALIVGMGGKLTPVNLDIGWWEVMKDFSVSGWVLAFGAGFGMIYGVHYKKVGQWIDTDKDDEPEPEAEAA